MHRTRTYVVGVFCGVAMAVGGCVNGTVENTARARVTNSCDVPIAISVGSHADSYPSDWDASPMRVIDPGDQQDFVEPLDYPPGDALYVWVVVPGTEQMGSPHEVPIAQVGEAATAQGARRYVIDISGEMCPSS